MLHNNDIRHIFYWFYSTHTANFHMKLKPLSVCYGIPYVKHKQAIAYRTNVAGTIEPPMTLATTILGFESLSFLYWKNSWHAQCPTKKCFLL